MISVDQAQKLILGYAKLRDFETCLLEKACGRILREDIKTDRDQPPFHKALMDGIAISFKAWQDGQRVFNVQAVVPAGQKAIQLKNVNLCVQIMTGAVLPKGCDCIIPVEYICFKQGFAHIAQNFKAIQWQFIRSKAADCSKGTIVLQKGVILNPTHIGIIASVGRKMVLVSKEFSVAVIVTGDELVDVGKPIQYYQTRLSNAYALQALLEESNCAHADIFHLRDNKIILLTRVKKILNRYDLLILSGGVSKGAFDFIPDVLEKLGVERIFHQVAQKPGKPLWFGMYKNKKPVFALPGNPVSTLVCAYRYVLPYLRKSFGLEIADVKILIKNVSGIKSDLVHFLPVQKARVIITGGSGDLIALAQSDGFIEYDSSKQSSLRPYFSWRQK